VAAYRVRSVIKVTTEGRNPTIENIARLNDSARQRGWQEATVWTQSFGLLGEIAIEIDCADLATCERQTRAYHADEECMKLVAEGHEAHAPERPGYNELWQRDTVAAASWPSAHKSTLRGRSSFCCPA
jgi:hypothetical protein